MMVSSSRLFLLQHPQHATCIRSYLLPHGHKMSATASSISSVFKAKKRRREALTNLCHQKGETLTEVPSWLSEMVRTPRCKAVWKSKHQPKWNVIAGLTQTNHDSSLRGRVHCHSEQNQSFDSQELQSSFWGGIFRWLPGHCVLWLKTSLFLILRTSTWVIPSNDSPIHWFSMYHERPVLPGSVSWVPKPSSCLGHRYPLPLAHHLAQFHQQIPRP